MRKEFIRMFLLVMTVAVGVLLCGCKQDIQLQDITVQGVSTSVTFKAPFEAKEAKVPAISPNEKKYITKKMATENHDDKLQIMTACTGYNAEMIKSGKIVIDLEKQANVLKANISKNYKNAENIEMTDATVGDISGKQIKFSYMTKNDSKLDNIMLFFVKENDLWVVEVSSRDRDEDARKVAEEIIKTVK